MEYRNLGGGLEVSAIGLGCLGMSGGYGTADADECVATIRRAIDLGVSLLDTADFYGGGDNERLVGRAVARRRDQVVIATRGGVRSDRPGGPPTVVDGDPAYLRAACDASLARLGVDHIDLYYLGRVDPKVPVEDSVGALVSLVEAGKVRHVGLSEASAADLRRARSRYPIAALETEYSLWERHAEAEVLPAARSAGVGFVAHTPLGKGMLAGGLATPGTGDHRRNHPRFQGDNFTRNRALVGSAAPLAAELGVTVAQLALAWLLSRGTDVVPIPGTRSRAHLEQNVAAVDLRLSAGDRDRLAELIAPEKVAGERLRRS